MGIQTTIALPAGVGVALLSEEIILVFLGDSWSEAVSFLVVLALTYSLYAFSNSSSYLLLAKAKFKLAAAIQFVPLVSLLLMVLVFFPDLSGVGIAIARFLSSAILVFLYVLCGILILGKDIIIPAISVVFRPVISVFLMACSVKWFGVIFSDLPYFILLFVKPIVGAVVYIIVILGMWNFQGRPEGAEEFFLNIFRKFRRFGKSV